MATTKEAMVIILDVGTNSNQVLAGSEKTFLEKEKECCMKLLQKKIFTVKKDEVCLILMGSAETSNRINERSLGCENIIEAIPMGVPNWSLVRALNCCDSDDEAEGDWLNAIILAVEIIETELEHKKYANLKIVLFTTFSSIVDAEELPRVIADLQKLSIELVVISDDVELLLQERSPNEEATQAIFSQAVDKTPQRSESERLIMEIIEETNGNLSNFQCVLDHLANYQRKKTKPWYWNSTLQIGNDLRIEISATISIKTETHFKFRKASTKENFTLHKDIEHFKNGEKIHPFKEDMIKGYLLGTTPIAYDESLGVEGNKTIKGLRCAAFTKREYILPEFLSGNGTYLVLAKAGCGQSQKLFRLLVKAMVSLDFAMIAARVYLNGHRMKLVALLPNITNEIPTLSMFELVYADQLHHWYFPQLCTKKTEPSAEQYDAIDKLIDSMDLMDVGEDGREAFPHSKLISPALENIYDTVTRRAIDRNYQIRTFDGRLEESLKMPEVMMTRSSNALKKVKELFPLKQVKKDDKKDLIRKLCAIPAESGDDSQIPKASFTSESDTKQILEVGTVTPDEDFTALMKRDPSQFTKIYEQMEHVLDDLIFKSMTDQNDKIGRAMMTYREQAKLIAAYAYNVWMRLLKVKVLSRKKFNFWENCVAKHELGLISISQSNLVTSVTDEDAEEFYRISIAAETSTANQGDGEDVDDLFDMM